MNLTVFIYILYLVSSILFIVGLKMLTKVKTARRGNMVSCTAMLMAIVTTLIKLYADGVVSLPFLLAGLVVGSLVGAGMALKVEMTSMPEMVAVFNGFGGGASALVALSELFRDHLGEEQILTQLLSSHGVPLGVDGTITMVLSILIGAITFTGSLIAFGKLKGTISGNPILFPGQHVLNLLLAVVVIGITVALAVTLKGPTAIMACLVLLGLSLLLGILLVIPIGGADMPVVISLLNSYSGVAAAAAGFLLVNNVLIIAGALVGASGLILTQIMCKAMNRSLANVLFGGFGAAPAASAGGGSQSDAYPTVKSCSPEEAAMIFESARDVIIVPGYGLAVAQAQHITKELADNLIKNGARVRYAIHPVAGRMPGHMNVLLAESNVPHEQLFDLDQINDDFQNADIALVLGANDVVNPAATKDSASPIYGMPVLKVWDAKSCFVVKRSLSPGFAAIPNDLFNYDNNLMLYGDAKKILSDLNSEFKELIS